MRLTAGVLPISAIKSKCGRASWKRCLHEQFQEKSATLVSWFWIRIHGTSDLSSILRSWPSIASIVLRVLDLEWSASQLHPQECSKKKSCATTLSASLLLDYIWWVAWRTTAVLQPHGNLMDADLFVEDVHRCQDWSIRSNCVSEQMTNNQLIGNVSCPSIK